jgi:ribosome recycling factor
LAAWTFLSRDDVRKAHDQMEKVTEQGQKEVKDAFEGAKKTLEQP